MGLSEDLERIASAAEAFATPGESLSAVIPTEPEGGRRVYLCAYAAGGATAWLALDDEGRPVAERRLVRDAVSIAAMCELAEEAAGGGDLAELRARLSALREAEDFDGIAEAEEAIAALGKALRELPRVASPSYLDEVGAATRALELTLGASVSSPFAEAMRRAVGAVEELARDVEAGYKLPLR